MKSLRAKLSLPANLFLGRKKAFIIDYPHAHVKSGNVSPYPAVQDLFDSRKPAFTSTLQAIAEHLPDLRKAIQEGAFQWVECGMFPPLDIIAAYCIVRSEKPARILEIGSGTSSHVTSRALKDNAFGKMTCIDPQPRSSIAQLDITFIKRSLGESDAGAVENFDANDILFIDSSHLMYPGFDTDIEFNRMFPALPKGAIVHVHDIFLPEDYPPRWFNRRYSEQNALIGWILSGYFEVIYPSYYVSTQMERELGDVIGDLMPSVPSQNAGSIWLRKT